MNEQVSFLEKFSRPFVPISGYSSAIFPSESFFYHTLKLDAMPNLVQDPSWRIHFDCFEVIVLNLGHPFRARLVFQI